MAILQMEGISNSVPGGDYAVCTEKDKLGMCVNVCQTVLEWQINVTDLLEMMSVTDGCVFAKSQTHTHTGTAGNCVRRHSSAHTLKGS